MTINYSCISDNDRRYRLPFGVPLEDIFPKRDLHPYLKKIFTKAYNDITSNGYSILQVTCKFQGNVAERLILKEIVTSCKPMPLEFPPGALLWVLRHFIGLLPLPLLPDYTNKEYFSWRRLSLFCKRSFLKYMPLETNNKLLIRKLAKDLLRLPPPNLLLFSALLNFIRALSYARKKNGKSNLDRVAAFCLVRYFSSSIFIRPFEPGRNGKIDRHYLPLLFYLVLKWSEIEKYFGRNISVNSIPGRETSISLTYYPQSVPVKVKIKDSCTQTENNPQCYDWLETISEESFDESFDFLRDAACQTENVPTECDNISQCSSCGEKNYTTLVHKSDSDEIINYLRDSACQTEDYLIKCKNVRRCCRCGRNYSSFLQEDRSLNKYCQTNFVINLEDQNAADQLCADSVGTIVKDINTAHDKSFSLNKHCQTSLIEGTFDESTARALNKRSISTITDHEFWHSELQTEHCLKSSLRTDVGTNTDDPVYYGWVSPAISSKSPRHVFDFCSPQTFISENEYIYDDYSDSTLNLLGKATEETYVKSEEIDLLERISKIGWTYTPPRSTCVASPIESPTAASKTIMKEDNYTLCFDEKEGRHKEEKESCSSVNSLKSKGSVGSAKSKKSFSIANIKNRFDIFKIFTGKRNKLKNSCSFNEISNIKYKKMNSVKSTLF